MKFKIFLIGIICSIATYAQQDPHYTQYMYNMSVVNPAYMINEPSLIQVGSLYRTQWLGIEGAPKTANIFAHVPLNNKIELSLNFVNDQIGGVLFQNAFNIDTAYKITLNNDLNVSFGVKTGVDYLSFDFSNTNVSDDTQFPNTKRTVFNFGAGVFVFKENFYVGLSSPSLIPTAIDNENSDSLFTNAPHLFLIGGYVFDATDNLKIKPSAVAKQVFGSPLSFDVSVNALYKNRFELGAAYRYQDAISALAGFNITPTLKLGYAYDFSTSELNDFNNGSHEFVLLYKFDLLGLSKQYSSPRFY